MEEVTYVHLSCGHTPALLKRKSHMHSDRVQSLRLPVYWVQ